MSCEQPVRIRNPRYKDMSDVERHQYSKVTFGVLEPPDYFLDVPCGWCWSCQRRRSVHWMFRLMFEFMEYPDNTYFVTLTFDEPSLKRFRENPNKAVCLFLDRYRKRAGKQVRHCFLSEYGESRGRLHYHGLLFNAPIVEENEIKDLWKYGIIEIQKADINSAKYVCKYASKGSNCNKIQHRIIASKGIGESFLWSEYVLLLKDDNIDTYKPFINFRGTIIPLPRYYLDKIYDKQDKINFLISQMDEPFKRYFNGRVYHTSEDYASALLGRNKENLMLGLTPKHKPPTKKVKHKKSILCQIQESL